ncbi:MAG: hypothetical protein SGILL_005441, partial [Bacillariaceae sp.]
GFAVTNGLFAYWPIVEWTEDRFGASSPLPGRCAAQEWFPGTTASVCDKCCGVPDCTCEEGVDKFTRYLRNHDDCQSFVARKPGEIPPLGGTDEILGGPDDFEKCTNPDNIDTWMAWMRCIDLGELQCVFEIQENFGNTRLVRTIPGDEEAVEATATQLEAANSSECTLTGYFFDDEGNKRSVPIMHSAIHLKLSADFEDVAASPNDVGLFFGYHSNIDRSLMTWQLASQDELEPHMWHYPQNASHVPEGDAPFVSEANGPYGVNGFFSCATNPEVYPEFVPFLQPWYNGTTFDEICNAGFPFTDIFDTPPQDSAGYTHGEILWNGRPRATPYIYDTMEASYYFEEEENEEEENIDETDGSDDEEEMDDGGSAGESSDVGAVTGIGLIVGLAISFTL